MDDDSDDEYFNRLQEHADKLPEYYPSELTSNIEEPITFRSDDEYYDHVNSYNTNLSTSILPENDLIWQEMIRSNVAFCKTKDTWFKTELTSETDENTSEVLLVEQWLFSNLPQSCRLYNLLINRNLHRYYFTSSYLYVDNVQHPSLAIIISHQHYDPFVYTSIFISPSVCSNNKEIYETGRIASNTIIDEYRKFSVHEHDNLPNDQSKSTLSLKIETNNDNAHNMLIMSLISQGNLIETVKSNINGLYVLYSDTVSTITNDFSELPAQFNFDQLR